MSIYLDEIKKVKVSVCYPGCDVIKFEINLIFLIKPFRYMRKKSRQKRKYLGRKELLR